MRIASVTVAILVIALSGCEDYDLRSTNASYLEPMGETGTYRWKTIADAVYPVNGPDAEAARLRQLRKVLDLNFACPNGYVVENRQATRKVDGVLGDIYDVFYTVRCE